MPDDKLQRRYELLDKLIEVLSHGEAKITWCDRHIVKVEKIDPKESIIKS